ncbi:MAG TPA: hypothetical protein ENN76_01340 [Euryarchaeota archaeon]|nr:hypothetical protein [Euryarchaeota archaeon]
MKFPNGKLVTIDLSIQEGRIADFVLSGDFFLHPEEAVEELEEQLRGCDKEQVERIFLNAQSQWELIGANWTDIKDMVLAAFDEVESF